MRLTGSKLELAEICSASMRGGSHEDVQMVSADGRKGQAIHKFIESYWQNGELSALEAVPAEYREECDRLDISSVVLPDVEIILAEVPLALDRYTQSGRRLEKTKSRDYSMTTDTEIPGTADLIGLTEDSVLILDVKTGHGRLPRPSKSLQLGAYALAAMTAFEKTRVNAYVGWIKTFSGKPQVWIDPMSDEDLDEVVDRIGLVWDSQRSGDEQMTEGTHCRWCPRFATCPAKVALLKGLGWEIPKLTIENAGVVLDRLEATEELLKRIRASLEQFAGEHPFPTTDGLEFGLRERSRSVIDASRAMDVLPNHVWEKSVTTSISKKRLRAACASEAEFRSNLDQLKIAGALKIDTWEKAGRREPSFQSQEEEDDNG